MSLSSSVFLKREAMPSPARWAAAIRDAGFALELDEDFDVETFSGYLPCPYDGAESGFEYFFESADTSALSDEDRRLVGDRTVEIGFTTHSGLLDLMSAVIAGSVLADIADGVRWDHESGVLDRGASAVESARSLEQSLRADLARERQRQHTVEPEPAALSTSEPVDVDLEATVVFRGGNLLIIQTLEEPTPRRFNLDLVTQDLPKVDQVRILGFWECRGRPAVVRRFSMEPTGLRQEAVERSFNANGNLRLQPGQVDLKHWAAKLGQVDAATRMLLAARAASVPHLLEVARDVRLPMTTRQFALGVLGELGNDGAAALPALSELKADPDLAQAVDRAVARITRER